MNTAMDEARIREAHRQSSMPEIEEIEIHDVGAYHCRAGELLHEAISTIADRASQRDAPGGERSMGQAVAIFRAWTGLDINEADGWRFMLALKLARETQGEFHRGDYVDLAGYAALLGECAAGAERRK